MANSLRLVVFERKQQGAEARAGSRAEQIQADARETSDLLSTNYSM